MEKIRLEKIKKEPVFDEISVEFEPGRVHMIMGASGSGKTTFLNLIAGLLQPDAGSYFYGEKEVRQVYPDVSRFLREVTGYVFQSPELLSEYPVLENILGSVSFFKKRFPGRAEWEKQAREIAEYLEISDILNHYPDKISGGEQQRVSIARALLKSPQILLCDEPTSALNFQMKKKVMKRIQAETREKNRITIVVSHDWELLSYADKGFYLKNGKLSEITYEGKREDFTLVSSYAVRCGTVHQSSDSSRD